MGKRNEYYMTHILLFMFSVQLAKCSRILMITLAGTKSHKIPFIELGQGLTIRGHDVTFINAFPPASDSYSNFSNNNTIEEINPINLVHYIRNFTNWDLLGPRLRGEMPVPLIDILKFAYQVCDAFLTDEETIQLMERSCDSYDLLILDGAFPECAVGLAYHFKTPFIYLNTVGFYTGSLSIAGNPTPYSITPYLGLPYSDNMNLLQRFVNSLHHVALSLLHTTVVHYFINHILKDKIDPNIPSAYDLTKNVSLIFQNGHFSVSYPRPYLPTVIEIACIHCRQPKPLPNDLENFISAGKDKGFIYVSMGSSVRASNMPEHLRQLFVRVFRMLPYQVLWKWEAEPDATMADLPPNVKLSRWFPQQDLLGHPKIRAFVTHGGLLSLFETVYHGVPVVAMPVFCDHDSNVEKAVIDGYAIKLELRKLTASQVLNSITNVIKDTRYKKNAKKRSLLLRDQSESPLKRAIYWTEYVLRHKGAYHLQSPSKDMSFVSYYLLDIIALGLLLSYLVFILLFYIYKLFNKLSPCTLYSKLKIQ